MLDTFFNLDNDIFIIIIPPSMEFVHWNFRGCHFYRCFLWGIWRNLFLNRLLSDLKTSLASDFCVLLQISIRMHLVQSCEIVSGCHTRLVFHFAQLQPGAPSLGVGVLLALWSGPWIGTLKYNLFLCFFRDKNDFSDIKKMVKFVSTQKYFNYLY